MGPRLSIPCLSGQLPGGRWLMTRFVCLSAVLGLLHLAPGAGAAPPTRMVSAGLLLRAPQDKDKAKAEVKDKAPADKAVQVDKGKPADKPGQVDKAKGEKKPEAVAPKSLEGQWEALVGNDAATAYKAIWAMVADPERSVPFLSKRMRPVPHPEAGQLEKLLAGLDSKRFPDREKAMVQLEKMGAMAKAALEKALAAGPSLEKRRRLEKLLDKLSAFTLSGEELRTWRALEALEMIGDRAARQVLQHMTTGAPGVWQTEEARAALERLSKRAAATP